MNFVSAGLRKTAADEKQEREEEEGSDTSDDDTPSAPPPARVTTPRKLQKVNYRLKECLLFIGVNILKGLYSTVILKWWVETQKCIMDHCWVGCGELVNKLYLFVF